MFEDEPSSANRGRAAFSGVGYRLGKFIKAMRFIERENILSNKAVLKNANIFDRIFN